MPKLRVLLDFMRCSDHLVEERAVNVHTKLYAATVPYPTPPVTATALDTAITAFGLALAAREQGGKQATANKNAALTVLQDLLRQLANYVQGHHDNVLAVLLESGFDAASTNSSSVPLATPNISKVVSPSQGVAKLMTTSVRNARTYNIRYALLDEQNQPGPWMELLNFTGTRKLLVPNLTRGANYVFQLQAIGGSTGASDWSNSVSAMCG